MKLWVKLLDVCVVPFTEYALLSPLTFSVILAFATYTATRLVSASGVNV